MMMDEQEQEQSESELQTGKIEGVLKHGTVFITDPKWHQLLLQQVNN